MGENFDLIEERAIIFTIAAINRLEVFCNFVDFNIADAGHGSPLLILLSCELIN